jgi:hypothetical protein
MARQWPLSAIPSQRANCSPGVILEAWGGHCASGATAAGRSAALPTRWRFASAGFGRRNRPFGAGLHRMESQEIRVIGSFENIKQKCTEWLNA